MNNDHQITPWFGISLIPSAQNRDGLLELARMADEAGLNFVTIQDHPYNPGFLDAWTLMSYVGAKTQNVRLITDVVNLPLRPPAVLAKAAASLDLLTGGRVELGIGAGANPEAVRGYGGPDRSPGDSVDAFEEAIEVIRLLWEPGNADQPVSFSGTHYRLENAKPGPAPVHRIGIWAGAYQTRMLELTGQKADGWIPSSSYLPPEKVLEKQAIIDEAAAEAGRRPDQIRRAYNVAGAIQIEGQASMRSSRPGILIGSPSVWIDEWVRYIQDLRLDTLNFYPIGGNVFEQVRVLAEEIVPKVRGQIDG